MTGGGSKVWKAAAARPVRHSFAGFFPGDPNFQGGSVETTHHTPIEINGLDDDRGSSQSIFDPLNLQPELPGMPAPELACRHCGNAFAAPPARARGRPVAFCSDVCRHAHGVEQQAAWGANKPDESREAGIVCRTCGTAFQVGRVLAGRIPHYCGAECRRKGGLERRAGYRQRRRRMPGGGKSSGGEPP